MMVKKVLVTAVLLVLATAMFSWVFVGLEVVPQPKEVPFFMEEGFKQYDDDYDNGDSYYDEEDNYNDYFEEFSPFPLEVFARVDLGSIYFMLPIGKIDEYYNFSLYEDIEKTWQDKLGLGITFKAYVLDFLYFKISADMPILEWLINFSSPYREFSAKFGIGTKLSLLSVEAGSVGRVYMYENFAFVDFGGMFFVAAGLAF